MTTNIFDMADTWNNAGTTFNGIKINISNGSGGAPVGAAASRAILVQSNGTKIFDLDIFGTVTFDTLDLTAGADIFERLGSIGIQFGSARLIQWATGSNATGSKDIGIGRNAAGVLEINDSTPGAFRDLIVRTLTADTGLRVNQTPTANTSAATSITNGADSSINLGHRASFNMNGTTYWFPCGATAF